MKAPAFWWLAEAGMAARLAAPAGAVVGAVAARRMREPGLRLPVPVVCIGNPTVGGAGKTPVALALADALARRGHAPVFLTRGYRGRLAGPVRVASHDAAAVGDEALLLAAQRPTVVARDRAAGGRLAATLGDVVVMDDGFQNPSLAKDVSLLVIDAAVGLGNGRVTPAGPLRAPLAAQLPFADAALVVDAREGVTAPLPDLGISTYAVGLVPSCPVPLDGREVFAFAGIGRPQKFFASVAALGATVVRCRAFGDHEPLSERTAGRLLADAGRLLLVTTAKDRVRLLVGGPLARSIAEQAAVVEVHAVLPAALVDLVAGRLFR